jgi:hypothetical protein
LKDKVAEMMKYLSKESLKITFILKNKDKERKIVSFYLYMVRFGWLAEKLQNHPNCLEKFPSFLVDTKKIKRPQKILDSKKPK